DGWRAQSSVCGSRQLGGGAFWCLQWYIGHIRCFLTTSCEPFWANQGTCIRIGNRWSLFDFYTLYFLAEYPVVNDAWRWYSMGKYSFHALCYSERQPACP